MAKALRKNVTDTERLLWKHLRAKQMEGYKFCAFNPPLCKGRSGGVLGGYIQNLPHALLAKEGTLYLPSPKGGNVPIVAKKKYMMIFIAESKIP